MLAHQLFALLPLLALGVARQPVKREVPQEHSHEPSLTAVRALLALDNPDNIGDPVFPLLGNAAAAQGQGNIADVTCLQQAVADQAFTNAKAAGDVDGQVEALIFRALERNTGKVGLKSDTCTSITAVNPEIAAVSQHQDPASEGAAAENKAIVLALAQQIAAVGGDPQRALESGTFAPGDLNDATAAGNTCDDLDDPKGCIFTQNLLVPDATAAEIEAAVAGGAGTGAAAPVNNAVDATAVASAEVGAATGNAGNAAACPAGTVRRKRSSLKRRQAAGAIDVGPCTDFSMTFAGGINNRAADEFTFIPTDRANFAQGEALNPAIISRAMCDTFVNACAKSAATRDACRVVEEDLNTQLASGALGRNQGFADAWLSKLEGAFGISSTGTGTAGAGDQVADDVVAGDATAGAGAMTSGGAAAGGAAAGGAADGAAANDDAANANDNANDNANANNAADNNNNDDAAAADECVPVEAEPVEAVNNGDNANANANCPAAVTVTVTADAAAAATATATAAAEAAAATEVAAGAAMANGAVVGETGAGAANGKNIQTFVSNLFDFVATPIIRSDSDRPFSVKADTSSSSVPPSRDRVTRDSTLAPMPPTLEPAPRPLETVRLNNRHVPLSSSLLPDRTTIVKN